MRRKYIFKFIFTSIEGYNVNYGHNILSGHKEFVIGGGSRATSFKTNSFLLTYKI